MHSLQTTVSSKEPIRELSALPRFLLSSQVRSMNKEEPSSILTHALWRSSSSRWAQLCRATYPNMLHAKDSPPLLPPLLPPLFSWSLLSFPPHLTPLLLSSHCLSSSPPSTPLMPSPFFPSLWLCISILLGGILDLCVHFDRFKHVQALLHTHTHTALSFPLNDFSLFPLSP